MIHLIGCGGIGFYTGLSIAREGYELTVYDDDDLEGTGGMRLPSFRLFGKTVVRKKVHLLKLLAGDRVTAIAEKFSAAQEVGRDDWLLDCTDMSHNQRRVLLDVARANGARYIRASCDLRRNGLLVVVAGSIGFTLRNSVADRTGYTISPSACHAMVAGGFAATVIIRLLRGEDVSLPQTLHIGGEYGIQE